VAEDPLPPKKPPPSHQQRSHSTGSGGCPMFAHHHHKADEPSSHKETSKKNQMLCRFLAVPEEDALWSLFYNVEQKSGAIVAAIRKGSRARLDCAEIVDALRDLRTALQAAALSHDTDFERHPSRGDKVTMRRLRPFLLPAGSSNTDLASLLYTGDSLILPTLWKFLGIGKTKQTHLQRARDAVATQRAAPRPHRRFLEDLRPIRPAVLHVCHFGDSNTAADGDSTAESSSPTTSRLPVHNLARLEGAYNGCVDELLRFCSRRSQLVCRYLPNFASDFRDHEFEHDRKAIQAARLNLLLDRRLHRR